MTTEPQVLHEWTDRNGFGRRVNEDGATWYRAPRNDWTPSFGIERCVALELLRLTDLARPRFPARGELPADGQEVVYETVKGFRSMGFFQSWTDGAAEFGDGTAATFTPDMIRCWWPAPARPSPEGAGGEPEKEAP